MMGKIESNTPYDDVFRTLYVECSELVLPLLNEIFQTDYDGSEEIINLGNEHFDHGQRGAEEKRITDAFIEVIGRERQNYHIECESNSDGSIIIRMFQYGAQLALMDSCFQNNELYVRFPNAAVMYLRSRPGTPDYMRIRINTPGGDVTYKIPTLKVQAYSVEEIFEKKLYFLIPFYIFNIEKEFASYETDGRKLEQLKKTYVDIRERLEHNVEEGKLRAITFEAIRDLANKVIQNLAKNHEKVREGIGEIMGGKVLDLEVFRIRDEGRKEGKEERDQELIKNMLSLGRTVEQIVEFTGMPFDEVKNVESSINLNS